jgi:hypothetical protein
MTTLRSRPRRAARRLSQERWDYLLAGSWPVYPPRSPFRDMHEAASVYRDARRDLLTEHPPDADSPWAFWTFEAGIPAQLRALPPRGVHLHDGSAAELMQAASMDARRQQLLDERRAWLVAAGWRQPHDA